MENMRNLGSLPTPFFNSKCSKDMSTVFYAEDLYWVQGPPLGDEYPRCMPEGYTPSSIWYYSPASGCPDGYTSACQTTDNPGAAYITCCPTQREFTCQHNYVWTFQEVFGCEFKLPSEDWTLTSVAVNPGSLSLIQSTGSSGAINAYGVQIRTGPAETTTSTHTPTAAPSVLSTGAIVGIVIGCTIPSMAIVVAVFLLFRRRKRRDNRSHPGPDSVEVSTSPTAPTSGYQGNDQRQHELDASQDPTELSNDQQNHEMDASQDPTELLGEQLQQEMDAGPPPSELPVEAAGSSRDWFILDYGGGKKRIIIKL
ncbi:hypothetical protein PG984_013028 [Apiospora sp. TS-2023a]